MYTFPPGATSASVHLKLRNASTGLAQTGLAYNSTGAYCGYVRQGGTGVAVPLVALSGPTAAWVAGGFVELDPVNNKGAYRLDLPNAALAVGAGFCTVSFGFAGVLDDGVLVVLSTAGNNVGSGAIPFGVTVQNSSTGLPLAGAACWVSTDAAGTNVVAGTLTTNSNGQVTFMLAAGPYYLWVNDQGFAGTNPTLINVS